MSKKRKSGILLPVASLPSPYGIGCFSKEAYEFVDFLAKASQSYWQILPLGQTGYGDSPYQSFSTFAGNPYFIDLNEFVKRGYLTKEELNATNFGADPLYIDYGQIYQVRFELLKKAYKNSPLALHPEGKWADAAYEEDRKNFRAFCEEKKDWLDDYALFSAVKAAENGRCFTEWPEEIHLRKPEAMEKYKKELEDEICCYKFQQYFFAQQWSALKKYANEKGIEIIGDIPIYVAFDSADTWSHPELFKLDEKGYPTVVAGCPPDYFSPTGQLWGNPIYRWDYHKETDYSWWMERLKNCFTLYDVVRIDHFRGFDEYYEIPYGDPTAEHGWWAKGPGLELFTVMKEKLGDKKVIAEDLGYLTETVVKLVKDSGFPGMKVLQFAFDSGEDNDYLPHNFDANCVVYTGTHDNETLRGWFENASEGDRNKAKAYAGVYFDENAAFDIIRCALMSVADTCVIPMQDWLNLGDEARLNHPSTLGGINWRWRLKPDQLSKELAEKIGFNTKLYGR